MRALVEALCSVECAGRAAGSAGGRRARDLVAAAFEEAGLRVEQQPVPGCDGTNLLARVRGDGPRWVLVGAHYDHLGTHGSKVFHGADDNAAAVAVLVEVGRALAARPPRGRSVLLAAFDGEEPPHFMSEAMGSARFCAEPLVPLAEIDLMVAMDLVGHAVGPPGLPDAVRTTLFALGAERSEGTGALVESVAVPGLVVRRADADVIPPLSDHWPFWRASVPFMLLTCGRWAHYHAVTDTPDRLDWEKIAATAKWLEALVRAACARPEPRVRFTNARDDASTLRSMISVLGELGAVSELASVALMQAEALLDGCDENGVSPVPGRIAALVAQIESALA